MPKKLDLTGQRYGSLVVINEAKPHYTPAGRKKIMWNCQCDCGNMTIVETSNLRNGHTTSCGCKCGRTDKTGQRFGRLVTIKKLPGGKYLCQCDCGNIVEVETGNLTTGNTQSCGCLQKERSSKASFKSLIGQRFGKLTVIERVANNRFNHVCYKCQCDCGGITIVDSNNLKNGHTTSCGCIKSKGEMYIQQWLQKHQISYITQYSHDQIVLSSGRRPLFDFAIFTSKNKLYCFLEYDGKQHFEYSGYGWDNQENFIKTQNRDKQKEEWCKKLNIPLYRIAYNQDIEPILEGIAKDLAAVPDMEEAQELIE